MALLYRQFNILGVMITPADNNQVFQASSNRELTVQYKTEITGAQERPFARALQGGLKKLLSFFRTMPISCGHAGTLYQDFSNFSAGTFEVGFWIVNDVSHA